jgi:hypothetical protein
MGGGLKVVVWHAANDQFEMKTAKNKKTDDH